MSPGEWIGVLSIVLPLALIVWYGVRESQKQEKEFERQEREFERYREVGKP